MGASWTNVPSGKINAPFPFYLPLLLLDPFLFLPFLSLNFPLFTFLLL